MMAAAPFGVMAKSYYVSTSGNDANVGSLKQPFQTIAKATSIMKQGDECVIMEGVYHESIKTASSGKKGKPIVYRNYKDDRVVIDAAEPVTGWTKHSGNIYKANKKLLASQPVYNTLYFEGQPLDIARWPNNTDEDKFTFDGHLIDGGSGSHFEVTGLPNVDFAGAYFCYMGAHSGTTWSRYIGSYKDGEIHFEGVDINRWPYTPHNPTVLRNKNRGQLYLYGKLELLDTPGEWYYDAKSETIYAMFPGGVAPKDGSVKAGVRATTIEVDHDYININGLVCFGGEVHLNGNYCNVSNGELLNCSQTLDGLIGISAQSGTATIVVRGSNINIENNLIEGGLAGGIVISPSDINENYTIYNNVIRYFNTIGIHANPVRSRGANTKIINNSIYTCGRDGISTSGVGSEIAYNDVFDCMRVNNDGGVFYTVGNDDLKMTKIHHNYFHDSYGPAYADGRAAGIYLDNNSKGYDVYNNVVWNVTWSGLMFNWYNTDFNFYNNTIWDCGFNMGRWENGYTIERIRVVNNYANITSRDVIEKKGAQEAWIGTEFDSNYIIEESQFVDVEGRNFTPAASSKLIDAGAVIDGFSKGYKGKRPDVGAYEYGEKLWNVGASWADKVMPKDFKYGSMRSAEETSGQSESEDDIFKKSK